MSNFHSQSVAADHLLRTDEVLSALAICRASLYRAIKAGSVPAPLKIGAASRWRASDIARVMAGSYGEEQI